MSKIAYLNSKYINFNKAKIHIEDRGLQFSDSVYEVVPFYNKKLIDFIIKHIDRSYGKIYEFVYKLDEISLKKKKSIDFKIIKEALKD